MTATKMQSWTVKKYDFAAAIKRTGGIILKYEIYVMTAKRILLKVQDQQREKKSANSKQNRNKEWHRDGGKSSF